MKKISGYTIVGKRKKNLSLKEFLFGAECGTFFTTKKGAEEDIRCYMTEKDEKVVKFIISFKDE